MIFSSHPIYQFNQQNQRGKQGEKRLDSWLNQAYSLENVSGVKKYQKAGIDRFLTNLNGERIAIEYKSDYTASRTRNLFFETVSIDHKNVPGWGWTSQADYWIFLIPPQEVWIFQPGILRLWVWQHREQLQEKRIKNSSYFTLGYPLALNQINAVADSITCLEDFPPAFSI